MLTPNQPSSLTGEVTTSKLISAVDALLHDEDIEVQRAPVSTLTHSHPYLLRDNVKSSMSPKKGNSLRLFLDPPAPPKKEIKQTVENPSFSDAL